jgi:hypothetical protein
MGQFSVENPVQPGSALSGNQHKDAIAKMPTCQLPGMPASASSGRRRWFIARRLSVVSRVKPLETTDRPHITTLVARHEAERDFPSARSKDLIDFFWKEFDDQFFF